MTDWNSRGVELRPALARQTGEVARSRHTPISEIAMPKLAASWAVVVGLDKKRVSGLERKQLGGAVGEGVGGWVVIAVDGELRQSDEADAAIVAQASHEQMKEIVAVDVAVWVPKLEIAHRRERLLQ